MMLYVNDEAISTAEIREEADRLRPEYEERFSEMPRDQREAQLLVWSKENLIERVLIVQEVKRRVEFKLAPEELDAAWEELRTKREIPDDPAMKAQFELGVRVERMLMDASKDCAEPTEDEARHFFTDYPEHFVIPEQVRALHIVKHVKTPEDERNAFEAMKDVEHELRNGKPFEDAVKEYSDSPEKGGDLGFFSRGEASKEFEDAVFALGVNETSSIIRSEFGYHVAKVYDRTPPRPISFEDAKAQIVEHLLEQRKEEAIALFLDGLRVRAVVREV